MNPVIEAMQKAIDCDSCNGANWYHNKHRQIKRLAIEHGADVDTAFAVYALLSINNSVKSNDKLYLDWLQTGRVGHFGTVKARVALAEAGEIEAALTFKNAWKVTTFFENLRYPWRKSTMATCDRHAIDIVTGDRKLTRAILGRKFETGYGVIAEQYSVAALLFGRRPHEVQAATWVHRMECEKG
jgi:hypothetical protein